VVEPLVIEAAELKKTYAGSSALDGLDLTVPRGSIFGLLGRNGAGKTTTIKILLGMTRPTSGHVQAFGLDPRAPQSGVEIRRRTGFVSEGKELYAYMTVEEIIRFTSSFYPSWRRDLEQRYLRAFDLPPASKVKTLSLGTRGKLYLLLALCRGVELLILDEPTAGLDPAISEEVLQALVGHVADQEGTVFISSHQLAEIDQIADHIAIVDAGRSVTSGPLDDVRESFLRIRLVFHGDAPERVFETAGVERVKRNGRVLEVISSSGSDAILREVRTMNPISVEVAPLTLKEIFLELCA
jgi:ABC-2 type transport system ATP-binding protein